MIIMAVNILVIIVVANAIVISYSYYVCYCCYYDCYYLVSQPMPSEDQVGIYSKPGRPKDSPSAFVRPGNNDVLYLYLDGPGTSLTLHSPLFSPNSHISFISNHALICI